MNLLFCFDRNCLGQFILCLKSILLYGGYDRYDVYILHAFFDNDLEGALRRDFSQRVQFHFIRMTEGMFAGFPITDRYPTEIYFRLAAPLLLPAELDRILYLDTDIVVIHSLQSLYETDFEGNCYVACTHTRELLTKINRARLGAGEDAAYINTGVLLMNLPVLRQTIRMEAICSYADQQRLFLPDQDILSALYGDRVKLADTLLYNLSDRILAIHNAEHPLHPLDLNWVRQNAVIIHYCGRNKPWKKDYTGKLGIFYQELLAPPTETE